MSHPTSAVWHRRLKGTPGDLNRRAGLLFMVGSTCFALGSLPLFFLNVQNRLVGVTFFVGSLFFTSAGATQLLQLRRQGGPRMSWWATAVQFLGMLFFNVNTYRAAFVDVPADDVNQVVWAPDFYGSICFLVASHLAWWVVCGRWWTVMRDNADWWIAALNYLGSIFFMLAALAAFTLPTTGDVVNISIVNAGTFLGAVGFFLAAYLLLPVGTVEEAD